MGGKRGCSRPMLFRTVYGPELKAVYDFVRKHGAVRFPVLRDWMVQKPVHGAEGTNLEEAVSFLLDLGLLRKDHAETDVLTVEPARDLRLAILERLPREGLADPVARHPLDPWFRKLLAACFVLPNRPYVPQLHRVANDLPVPAPLSMEKVNAWRRVMEFLGCGLRVGDGGFLAHYRAELVAALLSGWRGEGPLEECLEFLDQYIPVLTSTGHMAESVAAPLRHLERCGRIQMLPRADFAGRAFLGDRRVKWIVIGG